MPIKYVSIRQTAFNCAKKSNIWRKKIVFFLLNSRTRFYKPQTNPDRKLGENNLNECMFINYVKHTHKHIHQHIKQQTGAIERKPTHFA